MRARSRLRGAGQETQAALDNLYAIAERVGQHLTGASLYFDLAELRGYGFHTGVVFAAFAPGCGQEVARGGRYDEIGKVFGRARPATGFSADLKTLLALSHRDWSHPKPGIFAPAGADPDLWARVAELRAEGERVIQGLPDQLGGARALGCDRELVRQGQAWVVRPLVG